MLAGIGSVGPDGKGIPCCQAFYVWRRFSTLKAQEIVTCFVGDRIIHLKLMLPALAVDDYLSGNDGAEVIIEEAAPIVPFL